MKIWKEAKNTKRRAGENEEIIDRKKKGRYAEIMKRRSSDRGKEKVRRSN